MWFDVGQAYVVPLHGHVFTCRPVLILHLFMLSMFLVAGRIQTLLFSASLRLMGTLLVTFVFEPCTLPIRKQCFHPTDVIYTMWLLECN
jgi:hypothetical protein